MSERGVFAVDRGIWSDPDFPAEAFSEREAFMWLVGNAAWKPCRVRVGSVSVDLERGQLAFSTRYMAAAWKWSEARVRRFLGRLVERETICTKNDARATHVTICNYDKFQRVSMPSDASATHERRKEEDREYRENTSLRSVEAKPKKTRAKPKTKITPETQPTERQLEMGRQAGLSLDEMRTEWRRFRNNKLQNDIGHSDWNAAWASWLDSPYRKSSPVRGSTPARTTTSDLWAADALDANTEIQGGHDDHGSHDHLRNWDRAGRQADGRSYRDAAQSAGNDPRQLPSLRLVGGL